MLTKRYYEELELFTEKCHELIKAGGAYLVIIANHELYRFLYPYEPCLEFHNEDPVRFITDKIIEINKFLDISSNAVKFYNFDLQTKGKILSNSQSLEKKTSDVYTSLWNKFERGIFLSESKMLIERRLPETIINEHIKDKVVLDMGCGSGRYTIALALLGAKKVVGVDLFAQSYQISQRIAQERGLNIEFSESDFLSLPFDDDSFDFIFCNGTIHHSKSIKDGIKEFIRVLKKGKKGFLYMYADGGIFWNTRKKMREIFKAIPIEYTNNMLEMMGMPSNRFMFADVWHVPIERHTSRQALEEIFKTFDIRFEKIISNNIYDLDYAISRSVKDAYDMWGDGEHRYILEKK